MKLDDSTSIKYEDAKELSETNLKRLLQWSLKGDVAEERVMKESSHSKQEIINALVRIGVVS